MLWLAGLTAIMDTCRGMKIHVLDLNIFADNHGYPECHPEQLYVVDARLGIVYLRIGEHDPLLPNKPDYYSVHHQYGTHSMPWYTAEVRPCCSWLQSIDVSWLHVGQEIADRPANLEETCHNGHLTAHICQELPNDCGPRLLIRTGVEDLTVTAAHAAKITTIVDQSLC